MIIKFRRRKHLGGEGLYFLFDIFMVGSLGGKLQGCTRLLGFLGSGARNPHGILELGSQTGFVPSWKDRSILQDISILSLVNIFGCNCMIDFLVLPVFG